VLHSLGIAKVMEFAPGTKVLDIGTGGGFPGIPLAILFPETQFTLIDSIGKKNYSCKRSSRRHWSGKPYCNSRKGRKSER